MSLVLDIVMLVRSASPNGKCLTSSVGVNEWERIHVRALANNIEEREFRSFVLALMQCCRYCHADNRHCSLHNHHYLSRHHRHPIPHETCSLGYSTRRDGMTLAQALYFASEGLFFASIMIFALSN